MAPPQATWMVGWRHPVRIETARHSKNAGVAKTVTNSVAMTNVMATEIKSEGRVGSAAGDGGVPNRAPAALASIKVVTAAATAAR